MFINPEYKSKDMSGKRLHIAMVGPTKIDYSGNMDNEFAPEGRYGNIRTFICNAAVTAIKDMHAFQSVDMNPGECKSYKSKKLRMSGDEDPFIAKVPEDSCSLAADSQDVLLLMEQTSVASHPYVQLIMINFIPIGAIPHKPLIIAGKFVFWDVSARKPIAWGLSSGSYDNGPGVTMTNWQSAAYNFSVRMINDGPFDPVYVRTKSKRK